MAAQSRADAVWEGDLATGSGRVTPASGAFGEQAVSWPSRTKRAAGKTSPEELLAAAHASCFAMAFAHGLAQEGHAPKQLAVSATATFDQVDGGFKVTTMALTVRGQVPGIDAAAFRTAAEAAKEGCPISQALKGNVALSVEATLDT
jgi:lipoyl-dependent peroxiredoxin